MPDATGRLSSVRLRVKENDVQPNRKLRNGILQMNCSTKPSDKPSLPATRYRSFKMFAAASCARFDKNFIG